jgi:mannosyltransferase
MKNIVLDGIIFSLQNYGGISVYFRELLSALAASDLDVDLNLDAPLLQDLEELHSSVNLVSRQTRRLERFRACRTPGQQGIFHSSYYRTPSSCRAMQSVVTVHDFIHEKIHKNVKSLAHTLQKRKAIKEAQAIICISESTKADLIDLVGVRAGQSIYVIPNGVSENFKPASSTLSGNFALFVGERRSYKNFKLAAEAMEFLPDMELWCVGGGAATASDVAELNEEVVCRLKFLGHVSEHRLNQLYNQAHCLIYPSGYEGFGIPVAEAMKAGCPVVCLDTTAVIETGGLALEVANGGHGAEIAKSVMRLSDSSYRQAKADLGLQIASRYSWKLCHAKTIGVYRSLL